MKLVPWIALTGFLAGVAVVGPSPVVADSLHALPITSFSDLLVDQAHSRVFVAGGQLAVADLDGAITGTVDGISSARQMALTADGAQLVVTNGDGITVVDPTTATVVRTVATGTNSCPDGIAPSSGLMFFTYGDCDGGTPGLGAIDLANDKVTKAISTGSLVVTDAQLKPYPRYDGEIGARFGGSLVDLTTTAGNVPTVSVRSHVVDPTFADFAFEPDIDLVVTASPGLANHRTFGFIDPGMREFSAVETGSSPTAVDIRSDAMTALANGRYLRLKTRYDGLNVRSTLTFPVGTTVPARGLAFGTSRLFAVTKEPDNSYVLRRIDDGLFVNFWLRNGSDPVVSYGGSMKLTAHLDTGPTNRNVSIWAVPVGKPRYLLASGTTSINGNLSVTASHLTRNTTFEATFDGDEFYAPQTVKSVRVLVKSKVTLSTSSTSMSGSYHKVAAKPVHTLAGLVSPSHPGQCVGLTGEIKIGTRWVQFQNISCVKTTSASRFSLRMVGFERGDKVRVRASFRADKVNTGSPETTYYILFT